MSFFEIQTQTGWERVFENFAARCQPQAGWAALDVGCGPGLLPALLMDQRRFSHGSLMQNSSPLTPTSEASLGHFNPC